MAGATIHSVCFTLLPGIMTDVWIWWPERAEKDLSVIMAGIVLMPASIHLMMKGMINMNCYLCDNQAASIRWSSDDDDVKIYVCTKCRDQAIRVLEFSPLVHCRYCDQKIAFVRTENNKTMPVEPQPTLAGGTIINHRGKTLKDAAPGILGWIPHFAVCPSYPGSRKVGKDQII